MLNNCIDSDKSIAELQILIEDLNSAGLRTTISPGPEKSLLVLVKAPKNLLGREVYKSRYGSLNSSSALESSGSDKIRVKDWLYGVTQHQPESSNGSIRGETETENLRSMFHLVTWNKKLGGAGVYPQHGKWKNVKAVYPLHNRAATKAMLLKWSRQLRLRQDDLDQIRGLFGEKVITTTENVANFADKY